MLFVEVHKERSHTVRKSLAALVVVAAFLAVAPSQAAAAATLPAGCLYAKKVNVFSVIGPFYPADGVARVDSFSRLCQYSLLRYGLWRYTGYHGTVLTGQGSYTYLRFRHV